MTVQVLVFATRNAGKVKELRHIFAQYPTLCGLEVWSVEEAEARLGRTMPPVVEDGLTFDDNAAKKARATSAVFGLPALADDSGLQVDALGGAPGVYSARYAGPEATDADNNSKLLGELALLAELATLEAARRTERSGAPGQLAESEAPGESGRGAPGGRVAPTAGGGSAPAPLPSAGAFAAQFVTTLAFCGGPPDDAILLSRGVCRGELLSSPRGDGGFGYDPLFWSPELGCTFAEATMAQKSQVSHRARAMSELAPTLEAWFAARGRPLRPV